MYQFPSIVDYGACENNLGFDNTPKIQAAIDDLCTKYNGGKLIIPPGNFWKKGPLIGRAAISLVGCGVGCSSIRNDHDDVDGIYFDATSSYASVRDLTIIGYLDNSGGNHNCLSVAQNALVDFDSIRAWGGVAGLHTQGNDGEVRGNSYICGQQYGITSNGANWYNRVKIDAPDNNPRNTAFLHGWIPGMALLLENHFSMCDMSGNFSNSVSINDSPGSGQSVTVFEGCVMSSPVTVGANRKTTLVGCENGGSISAGVQVIGPAF